MPFKISSLLPLCAAALAGALTISVPAEASSLKPHSASITIAAERPPVPEAAPVVQSDSIECPRIRRRLWVEGEGWIVRRVASCR
jgi:hypothetical protein